MAVLCGLSSAVLFGTIDLVVTQVTKTVGMKSILVMAHLSAAGVLVLFLLFQPSPMIAPLPVDALPLLLGVGGGLGLVSCLTNLSLYKALSLGPLTVISPLTASYGLITMLLAVLFLHEKLSTPVSLILVLMLAGMLLVTGAGEKKGGRRGKRLVPPAHLIFGGAALVLSLGTVGVLSFLLSWLEFRPWFVLFCCGCEGMCLFLACCLALFPLFTQLSGHAGSSSAQSGVIFGVGALCGFGVEYFLLSLATARLGPVYPVIASRFCSALLLLILGQYRQQSRWSKITGRQIGLIALIGLLDSAGTVLYTLGARESTMLTAALSSTYPLLPVLVGTVWYRERLRSPQWLGVSIMILGMVTLPLISM